MIAKRTIKDAPIATGINMKLMPLAPRIAIIGFAQQADGLSSLKSLKR